MKKIRLIVATWLLTSALNAQVSHVTKFNTTHFDFSKAKTMSIAKEDFTRFDLPVYPLNAIPGNPELPVRYVRLIIPPGEKVSNIQIEVTKANTHTIEAAVYLVQEPVPVGESNDSFTSPNKGIYNSDGPYPANAVELVSSGYFNGSTHIATFAVYPVQYYPRSKKIVEFSSVAFTVETKVPKSETIQPIAPNAGNLKMYNNLLEQLVVNSEYLYSSLIIVNHLISVISGSDFFQLLHCRCFKNYLNR